MFRHDATFAGIVKPSLVGRSRVDDPPLVRRMKYLGVVSSVAASRVAVVALFVVAESFRGGSFEDDEEEGPEGWNAGCDDEGEDFVARWKRSVRRLSEGRSLRFLRIPDPEIDGFPCHQCLSLCLTHLPHQGVPYR